jgi:hypothetical protein
MPEIEVIALFDPLTVFDSEEDAEIFITWLTKSSLGLVKETEKDGGGPIEPISAAYHLVKHFFPDISNGTAALLASAASYRIKHALDHTEGQA